MFGVEGPAQARDVTIEKATFEMPNLSRAVLMEDCAFCDEWVFQEELRHNPMIFFAAYGLRRDFAHVIDPRFIAVTLGTQAEDQQPGRTMIGFLIATVDHQDDESEVSTLLTSGVSRWEDEREAIHSKLIGAWQEEGYKQQWAELHVYPTMDGMVDDIYQAEHGFESFPDVYTTNQPIAVPALLWSPPRRRGT